MKNVARSVGLSCAILLALTPFLSCRSALHGEGEGRIVIALPALEGAARDGARGLLDSWPMDGLPVFSSLTVTVSGPGMAPVTRQLSSYGGPIEIAVPPGSSRSVNVRAVPDWSATATKYPGKPIPTLAKAYAGAATVDVAPNEAAPVAIALSLAETRILVPRPWFQDGSKLMVADSPSAAPVAQYQDLSMSEICNFVITGNSILYTARPGSSVDVYADTSLPYEESYVFSTNVDAIAVDTDGRRLYGYYYSDGASLTFFDLSTTPTQIFVDYENEPSWGRFDSIYGGGITAIGNGLIAMSVERREGETLVSGLAVLAISRQGSTASSSLIAFAAFEALGLGYSYENEFYPLNIQDLSYINGVILIAVSEIILDGSSQDCSRGMVVALDPSTLALRWKSGWSGDDNRFPIDPQTQFYGPTRFVGFTQSSVYVVDDGYFNDSQPTDVDRIIEISTVDGTFRGRGLEGASQFYFRVPQ